MSHKGQTAPCQKCGFTVNLWADDFCSWCGEEIHAEGCEPPDGRVFHGVAYYAIHGWPDEVRDDARKKEQARAREKQEKFAERYSPGVHKLGEAIRAMQKGNPRLTPLETPADGYFYVNHAGSQHQVSAGLHGDTYDECCPDCMETIRGAATSRDTQFECSCGKTAVRWKNNTAIPEPVEVVVSPGYLTPITPAHPPAAFNPAYTGYFTVFHGGEEVAREWGKVGSARQNYCVKCNSYLSTPSETDAASSHSCPCGDLWVTWTPRALVKDAEIHAIGMSEKQAQGRAARSPRVFNAYVRGGLTRSRKARGGFSIRCAECKDVGDVEAQLFANWRCKCGRLYAACERESVASKNALPIQNVFGEIPSIPPDTTEAMPESLRAKRICGYCRTWHTAVPKGADLANLEEDFRLPACEMGPEGLPYYFQCDPDCGEFKDLPDGVTYDVETQLFSTGKWTHTTLASAVFRGETGVNGHCYSCKHASETGKVPVSTCPPSDLTCGTADHHSKWESKAS